VWGAYLRDDRPFIGLGREVRRPARAFNGWWWSAASMLPVTRERKWGDTRRSGQQRLAMRKGKQKRSRAVTFGVPIGNREGATRRHAVGRQWQLSVQKEEERLSSGPPIGTNAEWAGGLFTVFKRKIRMDCFTDWAENSR
jgi:hypothetical protein